MLHITALTKVYRGGARANDAVSLHASAGQVTALLGHNGAGKSTLLNQVAGLTRPSAGTISLLGRDVVREPAYARRVCSFQPQGHAPLQGVTVRQAIRMAGRLRGGDAGGTDELLAALDIEQWADTPGERLSGGVRRLTAFAMAVVTPGRLIMLDEPTNDVDPARRRLLWERVRALAAAGHAVVLVTHNIAEAERVVDHAVVLDHGRVVAAGSPAAFPQSLEETYLAVTR